MFPTVLRIFCMPCMDNTGYSAYVCFHAGRCLDMRYSVPGIWWNMKGCVSVNVQRFWQDVAHVWMIVKDLEMCWCIMCGHMIKHSEMVDMYAGHFGVWGCKPVEGIWMVLKVSKVHKCQNMRKCGFMCVERVHTHHQLSPVFSPQNEAAGNLNQSRPFQIFRNRNWTLKDWS